MLGSTDRIITSHVGSLPRPDDLIETNRARGARRRRRRGKFSSAAAIAVSE